MDWKLELVAAPVAHVDRAITFYRDRAGFTLDQDFRLDQNVRFVQLAPPGSACSIAWAKASPTPRPARSVACSWWWTEPKPPGPNWRRAA